MDEEDNNLTFLAKANNRGFYDDGTLAHVSGFPQPGRVVRHRRRIFSEPADCQALLLTCVGEEEFDDVCEEKRTGNVTGEDGRIRAVHREFTNLSKLGGFSTGDSSLLLSDSGDLADLVSQEEGPLADETPRSEVSSSSSGRSSRNDSSARSNNGGGTRARKGSCGGGGGFGVRFSGHSGRRRYSSQGDNSACSALRQGAPAGGGGGGGGGSAISVVLTCTDCSRSFTKPERLRQHILYKHHDASNMTSAIAATVVAGQGAAATLIKAGGESPTPRPPPHGVITSSILSPAMFECRNCGKAFASKFQLGRHLKAHHHQSPDSRFACDLCDQSFATRDLLRTHERCGHLTLSPPPRTTAAAAAAASPHLQLSAAEDHLLAESCQPSSESSSRPTVGGQGLVTSSGVFKRGCRDLADKRFQCQQCSKRFPTSKDLKRHDVVHTGNREFQCSFCSHRFGRKDHRMRHEKKTHANELLLQQQQQQQQLVQQHQTSKPTVQQQPSSIAAAAPPSTLPRSPHDLSSSSPTMSTSSPSSLSSPSSIAAAVVHHSSQNVRSSSSLSSASSGIGASSMVAAAGGGLIKAPHQRGVVFATANFRPQGQDVVVDEGLQQQQPRWRHSSLPAELQTTSVSGELQAAAPSPLFMPYMPSGFVATAAAALSPVPFESSHLHQQLQQPHQQHQRVVVAYRSLAKDEVEDVDAEDGGDEDEEYDYDDEADDSMSIGGDTARYLHSLSIRNRNCSSSSSCVSVMSPRQTETKADLTTAVAGFAAGSADETGSSSSAWKTYLSGEQKLETELQSFMMMPAATANRVADHHHHHPIIALQPRAAANNLQDSREELDWFMSFISAEPKFSPTAEDEGRRDDELSMIDVSLKPPSATAATTITTTTTTASQVESAVKVRDQFLAPHLLDNIDNVSDGVKPIEEFFVKFGGDAGSNEQRYFRTPSSSSPESSSPFTPSEEAVASMTMRTPGGAAVAASLSPSSSQSSTTSFKSGSSTSRVTVASERSPAVGTMTPTASSSLAAATYPVVDCGTALSDSKWPLEKLSGDLLTRTKNPVLPSVYFDNNLIVPEPLKQKYHSPRDSLLFEHDVMDVDSFLKSPLAADSREIPESIFNI